jgi:hypothetical protein
MPELKKTEVTFEVRMRADGHTYIALVFSRGGIPLSTGGLEFSLELAEGMPPDVASTVADVLSKTISHVAMVAESGGL